MGDQGEHGQRTEHMANAAPLQTILAKVRRDEHRMTDLLLACTFSDVEVRSLSNGAQCMHRLRRPRSRCVHHTPYACLEQSACNLMVNWGVYHTLNACIERSACNLIVNFGPNYHFLVQTTIEVHVNQDSVSQEGGQSSLGQNNGN